ncbi:MAG: hypothetical protein NT062_00530 [Proteobacteria bacterium]|nr:hypothetical protein [Pseudomonadota bacterium]
MILQRVKRNDTMDIFQYTSYKPGAKLVKLSPPTADGKLETLCCTNVPGFEQADISGYDISFDAKQIVFSAKLAENQAYGLFMLTLDDGHVDQIPTDPMRDYVSPIFLPGDRIMFTTNAIVEPGAPQHVDEYERGKTIQLGRINLDGTHEELGPRNLSHRTAPSLAADGRVIFTQWDHLGPENSGHLMFVNQDMEELREAFGKEGKGASNSTLKASEISPGRFVAIATARNRTVNAGALVDIRLGTKTVAADGSVRADTDMSEATSSYNILTPDVPTDNSPSADSVGRYYDAHALNAKEKPDLLVSWADGPVESSYLEAGGKAANFGVYLYVSETQQRRPLLDDPEMWDIFPRPLITRTAPPVVGSAEGFPRMFGTTMFEGQASLGVAPLQPDGSWLATVPANVPLHLQSVDKFGMALFNEPVWFSGRAGESRVCGGCHESRTDTTVINPGITQAFAVGPTAMMGDVPRANRLASAADLANENIITVDAQNRTTGDSKLVGMAWDKAIQPIFDAKCVSCHNGVAGPANPSYTITDVATGASVTWTFNLSGTKIPLTIGGTMIESFTASYFSMAGPDMEQIEKGGLMVSGDFKVYMSPENARGSILMQKLNPTQLYPNPDASKRAFDLATNPAHSGGKFTELTAAEFYKLILAADMGVNFYARENNPHSSTY